MLDERGLEYEVVSYLNGSLTVEVLKKILALLGKSPIEVVRTHEVAYDQYRNRALTDQELIDVIVEHPILLERPIVVVGDRAVIARPCEVLLKLL